MKKGIAIINAIRRKLSLWAFAPLLSLLLGGFSWWSSHAQGGEAARIRTSEIVFAPSPARRKTAPSSVKAEAAQQPQATFTVTNANNSGAGSLRQALLDANANGAEVDDINFDAAFFATPRVIRLLGVLPEISTSLNIRGPGANLLTVQRESGGDYRIFTILVAGAEVSISGLTIANGRVVDNVGGGILSNSNLTLENCAIVNNEAVTLVSNFVTSGGGVTLNANGAFTNCVFSGNQAGVRGGAIYYLNDRGGAHTLRLVNSTLSGNRVIESGVGGGLYNFASNGTNRLEVTNSTIVNNIINVMPTSNTGGLLLVANNAGNQAELTIRNSIVANNGGVNLQARSFSGAVVSVVSQGFNLASDNSGGLLTQPTDKLNANPLLGPLQNNGGPTETHALLAGSPALDAGNSFSAANDQRGAARPFDIAGIAPAAGGDNADIGAVEMQAVIVTNANDAGAGSLRQALTNANANGPGQDDIIFDNAVFSAAQSINLAEPLPDINTNLSINGPGANLLTVRRDANLAGIYRVFNIPEPDFNIAMSGLTIRDGKANGFGGGIFSFSRLSLTNCALINNESSAFTGGGGVYLGFDGTFTNCVFSGNTGGLQGGGINFQGDGGHTLRLINSTVSGNRVPDVGLGAGVINASLSGTGALEVVNSTIVNNTITDTSNENATGGIYNVASNGGSLARVTLRNSIIANNAVANLRVAASGGAVASTASQGFNLSDNGNGFLTQTTDKTAAPLLGPLADNGGPTQTHALLLGSPALDAGQSSGVGIDQRGLARPFDLTAVPNANGGDGADIGAFEAQTAPSGTPTPTPTATATPTPTPSPGPTTAVFYQFSAANFSASEGEAQAVITVTRTLIGFSGPSRVDYKTNDNFAFVDCAATSRNADQRCDYTATQGTLNFAADELSKTFTVLLTDDFYVEGNETVSLTLFNPLGFLGAPAAAALTINDDDTAAPADRLFLARLNAAQEVPANNSAATGFGTVALNAAETQITVNMSFSDLSSAQTAAHIHGAAHVGVNAPVLFNLGTGAITNATFAVTPAQVAQLKAGLFYFNIHTANFPGGEIRGQILPNPLESAQFFVRQQYHDFLSRVPDQAGLDFWTGQIATVAGADLNAIKQRRVAVSNAFFFEQEYQSTGAFVFRLYRAAFGNTQPFPNTMGDMDSNPYCQANPNNCQLIRAAHVPAYEKFAGDRARLNAGQLAASQLALATQFANRPEFVARYPAGQTAEQFVDALIANIQAASGANLTGQRAALITLFNSGGRGAVLFRLAEDNAAGNPINNRPFIDAEYNRAFVTTQYFGYLRRDADMPGLNFWLSVVNQFPLRDATGQSSMVCAFITSGEYQQRFNSYFTRTNQSDCP